MSFLNLICKNVYRNKTRTLLTVVSISIGIAAVITLVVFMQSAKSSFGDIIKSGDSDFMIAQKNIADMIVSIIDKIAIEIG
jgi:putative ABC transport system permease protein